MTCYNPLPGTVLAGGQVIIHKRFKYDRKPTPAHLGRDLQVPCGKCIGCRLDTVQGWTTRCMHEAQLHKHNCALTLTYSDDPNYSPDSHWEEDEDWSRPHQDVWTNQKSRELSTIAPEGLEGPNIARVGNSLQEGTSRVPYALGTRARPSMAMPEGGSLSIQHHELFMKKLRRRIGVPVSFYMCGEYGTKLLRPHYHYCLFGYDFPDKKYFKTSPSGTLLYRSRELEKIWTGGHAWIGELTTATAAYIAGYVMKKMTGEKAIDHYRRTDEAGNDYWLMPEFNLMSRNPALGRNWWEKFHRDVTVRDGVYVKDHKTKAPRYYDKLLERSNPRLYETIKNARNENALKNPEEKTPARLQAREEVQSARLSLKKRNLENL